PWTITRRTWSPIRTSAPPTRPTRTHRSWKTTSPPQRTLEFRSKTRPRRLRRGRSVLDALDPSLHDQLAKARDFLGDATAQAIGAVADHLEAERAQLVVERRLPECRERRVCETIDDLGRRTGRRQHAVEGVGHETRITELHHGRHVGHVEPALRAGDRECPQR